MMSNRFYFPIVPLTSKTRKADRIVSALAGLLNYGHLHVHSSMEGFISQMDNYNPTEPDPDDDILDMTSMGVVFLNPALGHIAQLEQGSTYDGIAEVIEDESMYEEIGFGGCP